jgi:ADP-heptose:LPS heptosyltransferase
MKILIIQTAFIGDVVLATSVVEKLRFDFQDCTIDFLLRKGNEGLLHNHPHINEVWVFDKQRSKYRNLVRLIREIREQSYDYVINIQRFFTTGLITALSHGKVTIGFDKNPLSFLFTHAVNHQIENGNNPNHEVNRNISLLKSITDTGFARPRLYPSKEDYQVIPDEEEYVCIAPASVWFTKQFPLKKWCELIDKLPEKYTVYLIGGPNDVGLCRQVKEQVKNDKVRIVAGELTYLQSAALISKANMNFVNDSAPAHFASAMNAPVAVIYCSTVPAFGFGPLSDISHTIETNEKLACRPCGLHGKKACPKQHFKCADIDVNAILEETWIL